MGLGDFRHIEDLELRESVLPRTPAYLHLTATTRSGNLKRQAEPIVFDDESDNQKNDRWNMEVDAYGQPQKKRKRLRFLEELQQGSLKSKEAMTDSKKWKGLDDLVDMAYKIRVSDDQYDWDKLLEEDIEEDSSDSEKEGTSSEFSEKQREREEEQMTKQFEKTSIHLH